MGRCKMGMSSRLHGKMVPLAPGKTETCPYCWRQYKYFKIVENHGKTEKLCPYCGNVLSGLQGLQARVKSVIKRTSIKKARPKQKSMVKKASSTPKPKKK
jgi:uncharacterized Zn-finger protein